MKSILKIWDSLSKTFKSLPEQDEIKVYVCGPTVYDHIHIGHARMFFIFDILHRYLQYRYEKVVFIQNITDIDEKIIDKSNKIGCSPQELANKYSDFFLRECEILNLLPCIRPKVTENLQNIFDYILKLLENHKAYITASGIYLNTSQVPYNQFEIKSNTKNRVEIAEGKLSEKDFALWKFRDTYGFMSPWGNGIPGWHIECSSMSLRFLGEDFHIHGGGIDLKFPHHENEIAQSFALFNKNPAQIWMHNEMVNFMGEKMSKSLGNIKYVRDIVKDHFEADLLRYYLLTIHYRKIMIIDENSFDNVRKNLLSIRKYYFRHIFNKNIAEVPVYDLDNDLDTPKLFQTLNKCIDENKKEEVKWILKICGFHMKVRTSLSKEKINTLFNERVIAKNSKDYIQADYIRKTLLENYIEVCDGQYSEWFYL